MNLAVVSRIFLIGYRGAGKTTVAARLAERLGWGWVDADRVLEEQAGRSVRTIFVEEGEPGFRAREAAVLEQLSRREQLVIATGGGVILRPDNRARLKTGRVIWLTADVATLWERLQRDPTTGERRPALTANGATDGRREIEELLAVREPLYRACADQILDATKPIDDIVESILATR